MPLTVSAEELSLRQDRMASFIASWEQSPRRRDVVEVMAERKSLGPPAVELLRQFLTEDVEATAFRDGMDAWSRGKPVFGFGGPAGSMFLNQLVNDGGDSGTEAYLRRLLPLPRTSQKHRHAWMTSRLSSKSYASQAVPRQSAAARSS